jgi:hypothetical protein
VRRERDLARLPVQGERDHRLRGLHA